MTTGNSRQATEDLEMDANEEIQHEENGTEERLAQVEQNQAMLQLLADPDVRAVIEAKRAGKPLKLVGEEDAGLPENDETVEETIPDPAEGLEADDPARKLLERVGGHVTKVVDAKLTSIDKKLSNLDKIIERLSGVEQVVGGVQQKEVDTQIKEAQAKYKDFGKYKAGMLKLNKDNPGLNVQELYILAKSRAGALNIKEPTTESERPSNQPPRGGRQVQKPARPSGRKGFNEMLDESLNRLVLTSE